MALWMLYATGVALLLGLAARLGEWGLRSTGRPGRWAWAASLPASLALPAWARWGPLPRPAAPDAGAAATGPEMLTRLGALLGESSPAPLAALDPWLASAWALATVLLLAWLGGGLLRLFVQARRWPRRRISEHEVLVSGRFGPALLGLRRPRVVLPRWSLALDGPSLELVLLHEREHARAGDGILLPLAVLAVVAAPWNPALWWQLRRLRSALEVDCDGRVLSHGVSPARYARLLLELGGGGDNPSLAVAGLARPHSLLERRLTMMVNGVERGSAVRKVGAAALGLALVVVACEAPPPTSVDREGAGAPPESAAPAAPAGAAHGIRVPMGDGAAPVVFVDGERVPALPDLEPSEIDRVEVLKGDAARALLGDEAAAGVVRIWTVAGGGAPSASTPDEGATELRVGEAASPRNEDPLQVKLRALETAAARESSDRRLALEDLPEEARPTLFLDGALYEGPLDAIDKRTIDRIEVEKDGEGGPGRIHIYTKR